MIDVRWDNTEKTAILLQYHKGWKLQDLDLAYLEVNELFGSVPHFVDLIIDVRTAGTPPRDAMRRFRQIITKKHPNIRKIVFVAGNGLVASLLSTVTSLLSQWFQSTDIIFVHTLEEARQIVAPAKQR